MIFGKNDDIRTRVVQLIEIIFWLLIFEGALRKWILPFAAKPLYFIRDPFAIYVYYLCWKNNLFPRNSKFLKATLAIAILFSVICVVQIARDDNSIGTALFGLRMYFLNIPLAFIAGALLTGRDLKRIAGRLMLTSIPMAVIVFMQYRSPVDSWINQTLDGASAFNYTDVARASGTFSFTQGHELYVHALICFLLATWLLPVQRRPLQGKLLLLATAASVVNVLLDGNRGVFLGVFITLGSSLVYRLFLSKSRITVRSFAPELLCVVGAIIYTTVFSNAFDAIKSRVEENNTESGERVVGTLFALTAGIQRSHLLGNGIGAGTNGGKALLQPTIGNSRRTQVEDESELGRVVLEAGPLGLFYIAFRFVLAGYLTIGALKAAKHTQNSLALLLAAFCSLQLLMGQISFNGTLNGFAWICVGFALAAINPPRIVPYKAPASMAVN